MNTLTKNQSAIDPVRGLLNSVFADVAHCYGATSRIPLDIIECDDVFEVHASIPGYRKDQITAEVDNGILTITASRPQTLEDYAANACGTVLRNERFTGSLVRTIKLPDNIDEHSLTARLEDGVLELRMPKLEVVKAHRVHIA